MGAESDRAQVQIAYLHVRDALDALHKIARPDRYLSTIRNELRAVEDILYQYATEPMRRA